MVMLVIMYEMSTMISWNYGFSRMYLRHNWKRSVRVAAPTSLCGTVVYHVWLPSIHRVSIGELEDSLNAEIAGVSYTAVQALQDATVLSVGLVVSRTLDQLVDQVDCLVWGWAQMCGVEIPPREL